MSKSGPIPSFDNPPDWEEPDPPEEGYWAELTEEELQQLREEAEIDRGEM